MYVEQKHSQIANKIAKYVGGTRQRSKDTKLMSLAVDLTILVWYMDNTVKPNTSQELTSVVVHPPQRSQEVLPLPFSGVFGIIK